MRILLLLLNILNVAFCLENGLARTPPMGWMSWAKFMCQTDCEHHPLSCISENLYKDMGDHLAADGWLEAGYESIHIDDCWSEMKRDSNGTLVANKKRFPHGIKWLADYLHAKKLKFAIYEDYGNKTCAGYPGSQFYLKKDAETFAAWDVDYLKLDGCNVDGGTAAYDKGYPAMEKELNASGRPIVYSCSWPAYLPADKPRPYDKIGKYCNLWRNWADIGISWGSISSIIDYWDKYQDDLIPTCGPGKWHDPDMIVGGNLELTVDQTKAQFAIWSIWSAPLIMSNDLRFIAPAFKEVLQNRAVIAIDQDPLGIMGRLVANASNLGFYVKPVTPVDPKTKAHSYALAFLNRDLNKAQTAYVAKLGDLGLNNTAGYNVVDLFSGKNYGLLTPVSNFSAKVPPTGVVMLKATIKQAQEKIEKKVVDYSDFESDLIAEWKL